MTSGEEARPLVDLADFLSVPVAEASADELAAAAKAIRDAPDNRDIVIGQLARAMHETYKIPYKDVAARFGVSRATLFRHMAAEDSAEA